MRIPIELFLLIDTSIRWIEISNESHGHLIQLSVEVLDFTFSCVYFRDNSAKGNVIVHEQQNKSLDLFFLFFSFSRLASKIYRFRTNERTTPVTFSQFTLWQQHNKRAALSFLFYWLDRCKPVTIEREIQLIYYSYLIICKHRDAYLPSKATVSERKMRLSTKTRTLSLSLFLDSEQSIEDDEGAWRRENRICSVRRMRQRQLSACRAVQSRRERDFFELCFDEEKIISRLD